MGRGGASPLFRSVGTNNGLVSTVLGYRDGNVRTLRSPRGDLVRLQSGRASDNAAYAAAVEQAGSPAAANAAITQNMTRRLGPGVAGMQVRVGAGEPGPQPSLVGRTAREQTGGIAGRRPEVATLEASVATSGPGRVPSASALNAAFRGALNDAANGR